MSDVYEIENDGANYSSHGAIAELVVKKNEIMQMKKEILRLKDLIRTGRDHLLKADYFDEPHIREFLNKVKDI